MYLTCSTTESRSQHFGPNRQRGTLSPRQYTIVYRQRHHGNRNEMPTVATQRRPVAADPAWQPDIRRLAACGGGMICRRREELFGGLGTWGLGGLRGCQFLINCQSLSQNHVGLGDPDLHSGFRDRLFGHLAEDLTLSWSDARFIAWQHQNRRSESV